MFCLYSAQSLLYIDPDKRLELKRMFDKQISAIPTMTRDTAPEITSTPFKYSTFEEYMSKITFSVYSKWDAKLPKDLPFKITESQIFICVLNNIGNQFLIDTIKLYIEQNLVSKIFIVDSIITKKNEDISLDVLIIQDRIAVNVTVPLSNIHKYKYYYTHYTSSESDDDNKDIRDSVKNNGQILLTNFVRGVNPSLEYFQVGGNDTQRHRRYMEYHTSQESAHHASLETIIKQVRDICQEIIGLAKTYIEKLTKYESQYNRLMNEWHTPWLNKVKQYFHELEEQIREAETYCSPTVGDRARVIGDAWKLRQKFKRAKNKKEKRLKDLHATIYPLLQEFYQSIHNAKNFYNDSFLREIQELESKSILKIRASFTSRWGQVDDNAQQDFHRVHFLCFGYQRELYLHKSHLFHALQTFAKAYFEKFSTFLKKTENDDDPFDLLDLSFTCTPEQLYNSFFNECLNKEINGICIAQAQHSLSQSPEAGFSIVFHTIDVFEVSLKKLSAYLDYVYNFLYNTAFPSTYLSSDLLSLFKSLFFKKGDIYYCTSEESNRAVNLARQDESDSVESKIINSKWNALNDKQNKLYKELGKRDSEECLAFLNEFNLKLKELHQNEKLILKVKEARKALITLSKTEKLEVRRNKLISTSLLEMQEKKLKKLKGDLEIAIKDEEIEPVQAISRGGTPIAFTTSPSPPSSPVIAGQESISPPTVESVLDGVPPTQFKLVESYDIRETSVWETLCDILTQIHPESLSEIQGWKCKLIHQVSGPISRIVGSVVKSSYKQDQLFLAMDRARLRLDKNPYAAVGIGVGILVLYAYVQEPLKLPRFSRDQSKLTTSLKQVQVAMFEWFDPGNSRKLITDENHRKLFNINFKQILEIYNCNDDERADLKFFFGEAIVFNFFQYLKKSKPFTPIKSGLSKPLSLGTSSAQTIRPISVVIG